MGLKNRAKQQNVSTSTRPRYPIVGRAKKGKRLSCALCWRPGLGQYLGQACNKSLPGRRTGADDQTGCWRSRSAVSHFHCDLGHNSKNSFLTAAEAPRQQTRSRCEWDESELPTQGAVTAERCAPGSPVCRNRRRESPSSACHRLASTCQQPGGRNSFPPGVTHP